MEALGLSEAELWKAELDGITPTFDLHLSLSKFISSVIYQKSLRFFTAVMGTLIAVLSPVFVPAIALPTPDETEEITITVATNNLTDTSEGLAPSTAVDVSIAAATTNMQTGCFTPLQRGYTGVAVSELQASLVQQGYNTDVNGIFGEQTEIALKLFQRSKLLEPHGIYDAQTCAALTNSTTSRINDRAIATNSASLSNSEDIPVPDNSAIASLASETVALKEVTQNSNKASQSISISIPVPPPNSENIAIDNASVAISPEVDHKQIESANTFQDIQQAKLNSVPNVEISEISFENHQGSLITTQDLSSDDSKAIEIEAEKTQAEPIESEIVRLFNNNNLRLKQSVSPIVNQEQNRPSENPQISRIQQIKEPVNLEESEASQETDNQVSTNIIGNNENNSLPSQPTPDLEIILKNYPRSLVTSRPASSPIASETTENITEENKVEPAQDIVSVLNSGDGSASERSIDPTEGQLRTEQPSNPEFRILPEDILQDPAEDPTSPLEQQNDLENLVDIDWKPYVLFSLGATAEKYPYIVNPTDNLTFEPNFFRPNSDQEYSTLDFRFAEDNPILNSLTYSHFPKEKQFYWTLPNNKIVLETQGDHIGLFHEGQSTSTDFVEVVLSEQRFLGLQAVFALPNRNDSLVGTVDSGPLSILTLVTQVTNPNGVNTSNISVDTGLNLDGASTINILPPLGSGSTNSIQGGGSLFQNLDPENAPLFLQAFPTNDLKPLLNNGVSLRVGEMIPRENLERTGIGFQNPFTGEGFSFTAPQTSTPGKKIGQPGGGMNFDLLNMVVNPFQTPREREIRYLNSLYWIPLGQKNLQRTTAITDVSSTDWYRLYFSKPHKKTILSYDPEEITVTYESLFSNPGISATFALDGDYADGGQFVNATLGLALGGIYGTIGIDTIETPLEEAKLALENKNTPSELQTVATPEQRRLLNQRLHQNLINTDRVTKLAQVSGDYTFPAKVEENRSDLFQLRTGLYRRRVQYTSMSVTEADPVYFFTDVDVEDFGPLGFIGTMQPVENTSLVSEEAIAGQVVLIAADGSKSRLDFNSQSNTVVPVLGGRAVDLAFDEIGIAQLIGRDIERNSFLGKLYLPSIEFVASGTKDKFNYGVSFGTWFNLFPEQAGSIDDNQLGLEEPTLGAYAHGISNFVFQDIEVDETGKPTAIKTQVPFLNIDWNSATNRLNTFQVTGGYTFSKQQLGSGYSLTGALTYIPQGSNAILPENSNGSVLGLFSAQAGFKQGFTSKVNLEIGKSTFVDLEAIQRIVDNFSAGLYYQNYNVNNIGLDSREPESSFGAILRYSTLDNRLLFNARIGKSDDHFDARLTSQMRFNF